jgi:hypothetical protein
MLAVRSGLTCSVYLFRARLVYCQGSKPAGLPVYRCFLYVQVYLKARLCHCPECALGCAGCSAVIAFSRCVCYILSKSLAAVFTGMQGLAGAVGMLCPLYTCTYPVVPGYL